MSEVFETRLKVWTTMAITILPQSHQVTNAQQENSQAKFYQSSTNFGKRRKSPITGVRGQATTSQGRKKSLSVGTR